MKNKTVIYFRENGRSVLISEIEGILIPELSKGTGIEIDGSSYVVRSYGIVIEGAEIKATIDLE